MTLGTRPYIDESHTQSTLVVLRFGYFFTHFGSYKGRLFIYVFLYNTVHFLHTCMVYIFNYSSTAFGRVDRGGSLWRPLPFRWKIYLHHYAVAVGIRPQMRGKVLFHLSANFLQRSKSLVPRDNLEDDTIRQWSAAHPSSGVNLTRDPSAGPLLRSLAAWDGTQMQGKASRKCSTTNSAQLVAWLVWRHLGPHAKAGQKQGESQPDERRIRPFRAVFPVASHAVFSSPYCVRYPSLAWFNALQGTFRRTSPSAIRPHQSSKCFKQY